MGLSQSLYDGSPVWLQNLGISLYGLMWRERRLGGIFNEHVKQYRLRENYKTQDWETFQTQELRKLITAATQIPYYKNIFTKIKLNPETFCLKDLSTVPFLDKETIRKNAANFKNPLGNRSGLKSIQTSGTTGTPLEILLTKETHQKWYAAYETRCRLWAGVNHKMSRAMIGGRLVVPKANSKPPFWRYNFIEKQLYMSAFHISPANAPYYVESLNHYRPDYLVGYAYSHYSLARMILEQKLKVHQPKAVLTSSEKMTTAMRETIEKAYRCKVFDAYSGVEVCCLASECEHHQMHISSDVGIVELINNNGNPASLGQPGEIVATGLLNFEQPLIRYRTGDYAVLSNESCLCGRQMPILKELVGRIEDAVVTRDGREMVRFHGIFVGLSHLKEGQVIQESIEHIRLRLVVEPGFGEKEKKIIEERFKVRLGTIKITYELVNEIEKTERGKFRAVISRVSRMPK